MSHKIYGMIGQAGRGMLVEIECSFSNSLPGITIVGSASKAVDEAKDRLRAAFAVNNITLPRKRITINLAPADIPKSDSGIDLGMAASVLQASQQITLNGDHTAFIGELGLDGSVRSVRGIIGKLTAAKDNGVTKFFIAQDNLKQASLVPNIELFPLNNLKELVAQLDGTLKKSVGFQTKRGVLLKSNQENTDIDPFVDVVGQAVAKRALEIAAAGGHNLLFSGPPGTGKTMLAKCLPVLLPELNREEILEVSQLHSLIGSNFDKIITKRPFRSPHHSASHVSVTGGGHNLRPGEISLSHRGVLFMDELPEFNRLTLEALRQPLEDNIISVARAKDTAEYPANFILIATANPCPCGFYGSSKPCQCQPYQIQRYQQRLSGPIIDRIDIFANVHEVDHTRLLKNSSNNKKMLRPRIMSARKIQENRFQSVTKLNSDMTNADIKRLVNFSEDAKNILDTAAQKLDLSARSYMRTVKLARTIADLEQGSTVNSSHISEALQFRPQKLTL